MNKIYEPLISIIIPVFNAEQYICKAVKSVLNQTYKNFEVILIDDGSTDKSGIICDTLSKEDKRITVVHKKNCGVSSARNDGLNISQGEFVHFIDADDWIESNCYETIIPYIEENDVAFFGWSIDKNNGEIIDQSINAYSGYGNQNDILYNMLSQVGSIGNFKSYGNYVWNKIFRKSKLLNTNGDLILFPSNVSIAEDGIWLVNVAKNWNKGYFCNKSLYHYYQNINSVMNNEKNYLDTRLKSQKSHIKMLEILKTYNTNAYEIHKDVCNNFFLIPMKSKVGCDSFYITQIINNIIEINDNKCPNSLASMIESLIKDNKKLSRLNSSKIKKLKTILKRIIFIGKNNERTSIK